MILIQISWEVSLESRGRESCRAAGRGAACVAKETPQHPPAGSSSVMKGSMPRNICSAPRGGSQGQVNVMARSWQAGTDDVSTNCTQGSPKPNHSCEFGADPLPEAAQQDSTLSHLPHCWRSRVHSSAPWFSQLETGQSCWQDKPCEKGSNGHLVGWLSVTPLLAHKL